jgi:hypothetical protein
MYGHKCVVVRDWKWYVVQFTLLLSLLLTVVTLFAFALLRTCCGAQQ